MSLNVKIYNLRKIQDSEVSIYKGEDHMNNSYMFCLKNSFLNIIKNGKIIDELQICATEKRTHISLEELMMVLPSYKFERDRN